jgi:hypothetical protein
VHIVLKAKPFVNFYTPAYVNNVSAFSELNGIFEALFAAKIPPIPSIIVFAVNRSGTD